MDYSKVNIDEIVEIAIRAGEKILDIYENEDFSKTIDFKSDDSPLTIADKAAHDIIEAGLKKLAVQFPILSEEGHHDDYEVRKGWDAFWCVDPLDGTKEFIKKNGQFTVNIALIVDRVPVLGVVYAPVSDTVYVGRVGKEAYKVEKGIRSVLKVNNSTKARVAVQSRSHASEDEEKLLKTFDVVDTISVGSSLKFCMVAEGKADVYYRHNPTMEWDTAAGQAVVEASGGKVLDGDKQFKYNKEVLRNGSFLCVGF